MKILLILKVGRPLKLMSPQLGRVCAFNFSSRDAIPHVDVAQRPGHSHWEASR